MLGLIIILSTGLWLVFYYEVNSMDTSIAWVLADFGYWTSALFVYLGLGIPVYIKTFIYTKEIKPIIFCVALGMVSLGFFVSFLNDFYFIANVFHISLTKPDWISELGTIGNVFPSIGIIILVITYLVNIDYIYRLPNDVFLLMVLTKAGTPLHSVKLKTRKKVDIEEVLLSGMISAINSVFKEILKKESTIREISSKGTSILLESGNEIMAVVITDRVSFFLDKALKRYVKVFEKEFKKEIENNIRDLVVYDRGVKLLTSIFPFFIVEEKTDL